MDWQFHDAGSADDLVEDGARALLIADWPVLLCRSSGTTWAVVDRCPHARAALAEGRIRRGTVTCPLHGARFDLATGACIGGGYAPLRTFPVRLVAGRIEVGVPDHSPDPMETMP